MSERMLLHQYDWIDRLQPGDIVVSGRGTERIVRKVSRWSAKWGDQYEHKVGRVSHIYFSILRCSWTTRAYTLLTRNDFIQSGYQPIKTASPIPLKTRLDRDLLHDIRRNKSIKECILHCCDVVGVIR